MVGQEDVMVGACGGRGGFAEAVAKYRRPLLKHPFEDFKYFSNAL